MTTTSQELEARYRVATAKVEQLRSKAASYEAAKELHTKRLAAEVAKLTEFGVSTVEEAVALAAQLNTELDSRLTALESQLTS